MKTVFTVKYEHPLEKVWPYLAEPEKWLEYVPALIDSVTLSRSHDCNHGAWLLLLGDDEG